MHSHDHYILLFVFGNMLSRARRLHVSEDQQATRLWKALSNRLRLQMEGLSEHSKQVNYSREGCRLVMPTPATAPLY